MGSYSTWRTRSRQRQVMRLEPSRGWSAIGNLVIALITSTVALAALADANDAWPSAIDRPDLAGISDRTVLIVAGVAGAFAVLAAGAALHDVSRWRLSRMVRRASSTPLFRDAIPDHRTETPRNKVAQAPPLRVEFRAPKQFPKVPKPLHRVTLQTNVVGRTPMNIAYLRLFDNQPRARTFLESAWREFGYVFFLRAPTSVTRREFKRATRVTSLDEMFVHDDDSFGAVLRQAPTAPHGKGRLVLPDVAPTRVRVRDPYGSYPVRAVLCHGDYWKRAVDILLGQVHLVVLDLSGFTEVNEGTTHELARAIDVVPVEKLIVLCDPRSHHRFLGETIERVWSTMSADSPNAVGGPRVVTVAVTDVIRRTRTQGEQTVERTRLESNRRQSRRVAAAAQLIAEQHRPVA